MELFERLNGITNPPNEKPIISRHGNPGDLTRRLAEAKMSPEERLIHEMGKYDVPQDRARQTLGNYPIDVLQAYVSIFSKVKAIVTRQGKNVNFVDLLPLFVSEKDNYGMDELTDALAKYVVHPQRPCRDQLELFNEVHKTMPPRPNSRA